MEGPRAEELLKPSGMGAGGAASHSLAWASLPLLGPPAGALCEDTLCCRGKTRPAAGAPLALPRHLLAPLSLSLPGSAVQAKLLSKWANSSFKIKHFKNHI